MANTTRVSIWYLNSTHCKLVLLTDASCSLKRTNATYMLPIPPAPQLRPVTGIPAVPQFHPITAHATNTADSTPFASLLEEYFELIARLHIVVDLLPRPDDLMAACCPMHEELKKLAALTKFVSGAGEILTPQVLSADIRYRARRHSSPSMYSYARGTKATSLIPEQCNMRRSEPSKPREILELADVSEGRWR